MDQTSERTGSETAGSTPAPAADAGARPLKLRAVTAEDLTIFSAVLQDAVAVLGDMTYLPRERRFALMVNRYLWERESNCADGGDVCYRIRTGVHFDGVLRAAVQGLSLRARKKILELLSIDFRPEADGAGFITLVFAGGGAIQLHVECIDGWLADTGEPWRARCRPAHPVLADER